MAARGPKRKSGNARADDFVGSLAKGLEILSAFAEGDALGNQDLVDVCGLPKTTVSRLTRTLATLGYLYRDEETGKYLMGTRVLGISASVQRNIGLIKAARPFIQALAEKADLTVSVGTRDRLGIVYLEVARPVQNRLTMNNDAGSVLPIAASALGLAYIVAAPLNERVQLLEALQARYSDNWDQVRLAIDRAHEEYRRHGFVISLQSWSRQINAVAVPMPLNEGKRLFTFNCAGPSNELPRQRLMNELGPSLLETVAAIRNAMERTPQVKLSPPAIHLP